MKKNLPALLEVKKLILQLMNDDAVTMLHKILNST